MLKRKTMPQHKGAIPWNKGKKGVQIVTDETRKKLSVVRKGNQNAAGSKNHRWLGGITNERRIGGYYTKKRRARIIGSGGDHTISDWQLLKKQYNFMCLMCCRYEPDIILTEDHIIPLSKGGSHNIENIQPLCGSCNSKKSTKVICLLKRQRSTR